MRTVGRKLAAQLGPLFPLMRKGIDVECTHCTRPIMRGQVYFLKDNDWDGDNPICTRCGISIEMACGRMTYAVARTIPRYGEPYPDRTIPITNPVGGHAPRTPLREDAAEDHSH